MRLKINLFILITLCAIMCFSCEEESLEEFERTVKGVSASVMEIPDETSGFGTLSFITKLDITAPVDGIIRKLTKREGETVIRGEIVALLENPQVVLSLERSENNYSQAKSAVDLAKSRLLEGEFQAEAKLLSIEKTETELEQNKKKWEEEKRKHQNKEELYEAGGLNKEAVISGRFILESELEQIFIMEKELEIYKIGCRDQDLISAGIPVPLNKDDKRKALISLMTLSLKAELGAAIAQLEATEKELKSARILYNDMTIISQAAGIVGARYFEEGERVPVGEKILTLMDTSSLYAIFYIREKDALRIEAGMPAIVTVDGIGEERAGKVDLVYPQADSQSFSFLVRVLITSKTDDLRPGMFSRVRVMLGPSRNGLFLPASSLVGKKNNEAEVFIINGNFLSLRKVILGQTIEDNWEINSGIKEGEIAVLRPESDMREGTIVSLADM